MNWAMKLSQNAFSRMAWGLFVLAALLPAIAWGDARGWELERLTAYSVFPLLGMWAWITMSTHFMIAAVRIKNSALKELVSFRKVTGYFVLFCLLLHPGLLAFKQFQIGEGLPPSSFLSYVASSSRYAVLLGSVSWVTFISYEFFVRLRKRPTVARNWKWISLSQVVAMTLIFIHSLRLGQHLQTDYFRLAWIACFVVLLPCFYIILDKAFAEAKND